MVLCARTYRVGSEGAGQGVIVSLTRVTPGELKGIDPKEKQCHR